MDFNISLEKNKSFSITRDDILILQPEREHIKVKSTTETQKIYPSGEMVIGSVEVQPVKYQQKEVSPTDNAQEIVADEGYDALSKVKVAGTSVGYGRPDWYPNALEILNNASQVEKDGIIYYPVAVLVVDGRFKNEIKLNYSNPSYYEYDAIGGNGYIFSDNIDELVLGSPSPTHTWDTSKDFVNPNDEQDRVRWVLVFTTKTITLEDGSIVPKWIERTSNFVLVSNKDVIEFWGDNAVIGTSSASSTSGMFAFGTNTSVANDVLKYIYLGEKSRPYFASNAFSYLWSLEQIDIFSEFCAFGSANLFYGSATKNLRKINVESKNYTGNLISFSYLSYLSNLEVLNYRIQTNDVDTTQGFSSVQLLKVNDFSNFTHSENATSDKAYILTLYNFSFNVDEIILPDKVATGLKFSNSPSKFVKRMKIPENIKTIDNANYTYRYIIDLELYDNFDISGQKFAENNYMVRDYEWLKKLCVWLKDKTNDAEAGTVILGSSTLSRLKSLFLTYEPNTKKILKWFNIEQEGTISAFDFLTLQKNWTLS